MIFRTKLSFALLLALGLFACSTSTDDEPTAGDADAAESEVRSCTESYARQYWVSFADRSCADVEGYRGTWIATPLESEDDAVCTMTWKGEKYSRADVDALRAFVKQTDAMTAACGSSKPDAGYLTPIPRLDAIGMIGANGCDVCAKIRRDGRIIVVLPPFRTASKQFEVPLTDGTTRAFQINAPEGSHAVDVRLPPPPEGTSYAAARVQVY